METKQPIYKDPELERKMEGKEVYLEIEMRRLILDITDIVVEKCPNWPPQDRRTLFSWLASFDCEQLSLICLSCKETDPEKYVRVILPDAIEALLDPWVYARFREEDEANEGMIWPILYRSVENLPVSLSKIAKKHTETLEACFDDEGKKRTRPLVADASRPNTHLTHPEAEQVWQLYVKAYAQRFVYFLEKNAVPFSSTLDAILGFGHNAERDELVLLDDEQVVPLTESKTFKAVYDFFLVAKKYGASYPGYLARRERLRNKTLSTLELIANEYGISLSQDNKKVLSRATRYSDTHEPLDLVLDEEAILGTEDYRNNIRLDAPQLFDLMRIIIRFPERVPLISEKAFPDDSGTLWLLGLYDKDVHELFQVPSLIEQRGKMRLANAILQSPELFLEMVPGGFYFKSLFDLGKEEADRENNTRRGQILYGSKSLDSISLTGHATAEGGDPKEKGDVVGQVSRSYTGFLPQEAFLRKPARLTSFARLREPVVLGDGSVDSLDFTLKLSCQRYVPIDGLPVPPSFDIQKPFKSKTKGVSIFDKKSGLFASVDPDKAEPDTKFAYVAYKAKRRVEPDTIWQDLAMRPVEEVLVPFQDQELLLLKERISLLPPEERAGAVCDYFREKGIYDMESGEFRERFNKAGSIDVLAGFMRHRAQEIVAQRLDLAGRKMYAGVCADFYALASEVMCSVGLPTAAVKGYMSERGVIYSKKRHITCGVLFEGVNYPRPIVRIYDPTPLDIYQKDSLQPLRDRLEKVLRKSRERSKLNKADEPLFQDAVRSKLRDAEGAGLSQRLLKDLSSLFPSERMQVNKMAERDIRLANVREVEALSGLLLYSPTRSLLQADSSRRDWIYSAFLVQGKISASQRLEGYRPLEVRLEAALEFYRMVKHLFSRFRHEYRASALIPEQGLRDILNDPQLHITDLARELSLECLNVIRQHY